MTMKEPDPKKQLPPEMLGRALTKEEGLRYAHTTVKAHLVDRRIQTEEGMGKGKMHTRFTFRCPRCEEVHWMDSELEHGTLPHKCHCNGLYVYAVSF